MEQAENPKKSKCCLISNDTEDVFENFVQQVAVWINDVEQPFATAYNFNIYPPEHKHVFVFGYGICIFENGIAEGGKIQIQYFGNSRVVVILCPFLFDHVSKNVPAEYVLSIGLNVDHLSKRRILRYICYLNAYMDCYAPQGEHHVVSRLLCVYVYIRSFFLKHFALDEQIKRALIHYRRFYSA